MSQKNVRQLIRHKCVVLGLRLHTKPKYVHEIYFAQSAKLLCLLNSVSATK